jgi:hypothetical protein
MSINVNTPAHTDLLADTDLWIKAAATETDAALGAGYQYGYFSGATKVYDNSGTCGITVPGLNQIQGAVGSIREDFASTGPCLFTIASYNAGGPGTVYGQVWRWPYVATVYGPIVPPATIAPLVRQLQPMWPAPINSMFQICVLAWGTVL